MSMNTEEKSKLYQTFFNLLKSYDEDNSEDDKTFRKNTKDQITKRDKEYSRLLAHFVKITRIRNMVKEIFMKRLLILCLLFVCVVGNAQITADSIIMTVAGKQIPLDEFLFIAQKNSEVDLSDRKSVENYVELFKNFKLKVSQEIPSFFHSKN